MKNKTKRIALAGILTALVFVVMWLEASVFPHFWPAPAAVLSIPLMLTICMVGGIWFAAAGGLIFGLSSFALSFVTGWEPFMNPLISVLPRIFIGFGAYGVMYGFTKLLRKKESYFVREVLPVGLGAAAGVLVNSVLTLGAMALFMHQAYAWATFISLNFSLELVAAVLLVPVLVLRLRKALHFKPILKPSESEER